jgi:hypothetical protein
MRRFLLLGTLAALAAATVAAGASAQTVSKFSVIAKPTSGHRSGPNHFVVRGRLVQPGDRDDILGHFKARFARHGRIHAVAIFPDGKIKFQGQGNRIPIIGGTGRWNGAAGKVLIHNLRRNAALLTFTVVQ